MPVNNSNTNTADLEGPNSVGNSIYLLEPRKSPPDYFPTPVVCYVLGSNKTSNIYNVCHFFLTFTPISNFPLAILNWKCCNWDGTEAVLILEKPNCIFRGNKCRLEVSHHHYARTSSNFTLMLSGYCWDTTELHSAKMSEQMCGYNWCFFWDALTQPHPHSLCCHHAWT